MPFGAHKGYGLSLINEIIGGFIGGSLPTLRSEISVGEKNTPAFYFQVIHPDAISGGAFAKDRNQATIKAVLQDILGHGNENCLRLDSLKHVGLSVLIKLADCCFLVRRLKRLMK